MPVQPVLNPSGFQSGQVGSLYHIGLGDGVNSYGYVLQNWGGSDPRSAFSESSNVTDKAALTQYSSQALIDRDLAYYPRVSQGDFSGGLLQQIFIDNTREFDSDLEIRTPGYLMLRPAWQRRLLATGVGAATPQSVSWNADVYTTFGGTTYYDSHGNAFTGAGMTVKFIDTDGASLLISDGVNTSKFTLDNSVYTTMSTTMGAHSNIWSVAQGTNSRRLYFTTGTTGLSFIDLNAAFPTGPVVLATNAAQITIRDIVAYSNGIAILTTDLTPAIGMDVWYHDGVNMTRIVRVNGYAGQGMCTCLGDLYITAQSVGQFESPVLIKLANSNFEVVARIGSPVATFTAAGIGDCISSGQYVYFTITNPQINNVTNVNYIGVYDVLTGAYSHLGALDANDAPQIASRQIAQSGRAVTFPMTLGIPTLRVDGYLQMQTNSSRLGTTGTPVPLFATSGWIVSSKIDFNTPGIAKRFRRVEVHHAPLAAGEQLVVKAFIDSDPLAFTPTLAPVPSSATTTNSTVGSSVTTLTIGSNQSVGRSLYYAIQLTAGTNQQTTPKVIYTAIEVGGTWVWDLNLDCTNKRRLLNQATEDPQGVTGKDLAYLIRNAYENGGNLTLFLAENVSYTVTIEKYDAKAFGYVDHFGGGQAPVRADEEWLVAVTLKQVLN